MSADSGIIFGDPTTGVGFGDPDVNPQLGLGVPLGQIQVPGLLCPAKIACPGSDNPITNYTAENIPPFATPRLRGFVKDGYCCDGSYVSFTSFISEDDAIDGLNRLLEQCDLCPPPSGSLYSCSAQCANGGGTVLGTSNLSQADACARAQVLAAASVCPPVPPVTEFCNAQQSCSVPCPDGTSFTFLIPPCTVIAPTQQEADFIAFNLACARAQKYKFCLGDLPRCTCVGSPYLGVLKPAIGGLPPIQFIVIGALPPGLTFSNDDPDTHSATISGTPLTAGTYSFSIEGIDSQSNTMIKNFSIVVLQITTANLPDYSIGTPYSAQLTATGGSGNYAWKITAGNLPDGLSMSLTGLISGTPTAANGTPLTFLVIDQNCDALDKSFFPPSISLHTTSTVTLATMVGYPGYLADTFWRTLTYVGSGSLTYKMLPGVVGYDPAVVFCIDRAVYNGAGSVDVHGNQISEYTKEKFSGATGQNDLGNFALNNTKDLIGWEASQSAQGAGEIINVASDSSASGTINAGQANPLDIIFSSQDLSGRWINPITGQPVDFDIALVPPTTLVPGGTARFSQVSIAIAYSITLTDQFTDADALANASVSFNNGSVAVNRPRIPFGRVATFISVSYSVTCKNLISGEAYSFSVDYWDQTTGNTTTLITDFTATSTQQTFGGTVPVPLPGHQVMVRNPKISFA